MNSCGSHEFRQSLSRSMRDITRCYAGIELTENALPLAEDACTVHTVLEGDCRADLLLCADTALFARLARNIMCQEAVTTQDIADVATEYFNVVCGRIIALLFQQGHGSPRFRIPCFHPGRYLPEGVPDCRWDIGYNSPHNESLHLVICVGAPPVGKQTPS